MRLWSELLTQVALLQAGWLAGAGATVAGLAAFLPATLPESSALNQERTHIHTHTRSIPYPL